MFSANKCLFQATSCFHVKYLCLNYNISSKKLSLTAQPKGCFCNLMRNYSVNKKGIDQAKIGAKKGFKLYALALWNNKGWPWK